MAKILFVLTGADHWTLNDGSTHPTGYWAEEFLAPYRALTAAGHEVVVATPEGTVPPVDQVSLTADSNGGQDQAEETAAAIAAAPELQKPIKIDDAVLADYAAVYYPGGHGAMEDLPASKASGELLAAALASGKPLAIVCHGPAAIVAATNSDGTSPFAGYRLTGFTNDEENAAGLAPKAPWLLQDRLVALGADFRESAPFAPHIEVDRNLYTGQNPASSAPLAAELVRALS
ncbi:type 1 glutamine amidotransferase domain-containing protein [Nocardia goodfellowii]|uniref:Intracellular protease/amidase n=1 Tax=Nocardia goodfellowii TaxID=882446 RepID=A0ABS4QTP4_9NOCA|nr:type 1 glutamine amidotransferase domain-containing protein [Nocardia goodfellowii]MBP2194468.1 putative intracellular protease/amidase [Nocardia goodfellowii]